MRNLIRSATSSMTSVPKPLKFLRPHYATLIHCYDTWPESDVRKFLADILSVLSMTYGKVGKRESLKYRFLGALEPVDCWGHEFCRHLSAEIISEYNERVIGAEESEISHQGLLKLALELVPFFLKHNAEPDACDLMLEMEVIDKMSEFVDKETFSRVCSYIIGCIPYVSPPDDIAILRTAHTIYTKFGRFADAMQLAIKLRDNDLIKAGMDSCTDRYDTLFYGFNLLKRALKKQLAFLLARSLITFETEDEELLEILSNSKLHLHFQELARDLDILEPKTPEDIYKRHLENTSFYYIF